MATRYCLNRLHSRIVLEIMCSLWRKPLRLTYFSFFRTSLNIMSLVRLTYFSFFRTLLDLMCITIVNLIRLVIVKTLFFHNLAFIFAIILIKTVFLLIKFMLLVIKLKFWFINFEFLVINFILLVKYCLLLVILV